MDAWKEHDNLVTKYTRFWEPRSDLRVTAHATNRCVELQLGEIKDPPPTHEAIDRYRWHSTKRNLKTMRELATALLEACDFVEDSNPEWANSDDIFVEKYLEALGPREPIDLDKLGYKP